MSPLVRTDPPAPTEAAADPIETDPLFQRARELGIRVAAMPLRLRARSLRTARIPGA